MRKNQYGFSIIELLLLIVVVGGIAATGWYVYGSSKPLTPLVTRPIAPKEIVAIGDIACDPQDSHFLAPDSAHCQSKATHALLNNLQPDAVLALGDLQYENATQDKFMQSYDKDWGQEKKITYPTAGNHEYATPGASGYFNYFNDGKSLGRAGEVGKGYYSTDIGSWHIIALNSNCEAVGGCGEGSPQLVWLEQDLSSSSNVCTLAFWHHPHFTSGRYARDKPAAGRSSYFWDSLIKFKADVILNGHDHLYERFAPQSASGQPSLTGIRQFTVGTGGKVLYQKIFSQPNSEKLIDSQFGVMSIKLYAKAYSWQFVSIAGEVLDSGRQQCVN